MIMKILWFFIILFIIMIVLAIFRRSGSTKANKREVVQQYKETTAFEDTIKAYQDDPEGSGVSEDDYLYACYMAGEKYMGIDLKKAVAFQTTCDIRKVHSEGGMKNILRYGDIYSGIGSDDVEVLYKLGKRVSDISEEKRQLPG